MKLTTKNILPMWWSYIWRSTIFTFTGWTLFFIAYWLIAEYFYGVNGRNYIMEHKQIGLSAEHYIEIAVTVPAFFAAFKKYVVFLQHRQLATNSIQQMRKRDVARLWWDFLCRSFLYILLVWLFFYIAFKTLEYFNVLQVESFFSSRPYIQQASGYVLWLICSIFALKGALNKRLVVRPQKDYTPLLLRK